MYIYEYQSFHPVEGPLPGFSAEEQKLEMHPAPYGGQHQEATS